MKNAGTLAAGLAAGYLLGRSRKMKFALMVGGLAASRRIDKTQLLEQGKKLIESSPQLQRIGEEMQGSLGEAGKKAVVAAAGKGMDALSSSIEDRAASLRSGASRDTVDEESEDAEPEDAEPEDAEPEDAASEDEPANTESRRPAKKATKKAAKKRGSGGGRSSGTRSRPAAKRGSSNSATKRSSGSGRSGQRRSKTDG